MSAQTWLARHAQTLVGSLGRITQQPVASFMTMAVIAIALALPLFLNVFLQNTLTATANWNQTFDLSVYLDKRAAAARTQALAKQLEARTEVAAVRVITADEALAEFRNTSGFGNALDALSDNPLPDTLVVTPALAASTPEGLETLKNTIAAMTDVQAVQIDTEWVKRLHAIMDILRRVVWLT
ncbi:MAG: cell division transport system permease protein, partial [Gammaproteobacteria bacterium]|nr:cell division transport system permease protein [Gammaproteobacteria bacterium]